MTMITVGDDHKYLVNFNYFRHRSCVCNRVTIETGEFLRSYCFREQRRKA